MESLPLRLRKSNISIRGGKERKRGSLRLQVLGDPTQMGNISWQFLLILRLNIYAKLSETFPSMLVGTLVWQGGDLMCRRACTSVAFGENHLGLDSRRVPVVHVM